ncbi:paramyosin-like [Daktulosphaira vitifoliae]|uniref:paramyosin-like n=1 Tax=Daktulosphaira vitifoliae TaxID=58002 RepID=UPI0021A97814|nr:paramyosin-like [Daktulosphaira vitifoliae]
MDDIVKYFNQNLNDYENKEVMDEMGTFINKKALANEVGDSILQKTVNSHTGLSDRRGRAQYIILLQQKVTQLQEKLNLKNSTNTNDFDELQYKKAIEDVRREEREKKSLVELELKCALKRVNELDTSSKKWESRCKALDVEMAVLRDRLEKIQLKFQHNEKIIEEQEGKLKTTNEDTIRKLNKLERDNKTLCQRLEEVEKTIEEETKKLLSKDLEIKQLQNELKMCKPIIIKQEMDFSNIVNEPIHVIDYYQFIPMKFKQLENQQLLELLLKANTEVREKILQTTDLKIELAKQKQKVKRTESKTGGMRTVSSKTCSNTSRPMSYKSTYESKQISVNQIQLKIDILNEENAALKTHIDTLTIINKDQERQFAKSLTELNKKIKTIIPCNCTKFIKSDN